MQFTELPLSNLRVSCLPRRLITLPLNHVYLLHRPHHDLKLFCLCISSPVSLAQKYKFYEGMSLRLLFTIAQTEGTQ